MFHQESIYKLLSKNYFLYDIRNILFPMLILNPPAYENVCSWSQHHLHIKIFCMIFLHTMIIVGKLSGSFCCMRTSFWSWGFSSWENICAVHIYFSVLAFERLRSAISRSPALASSLFVNILCGILVFR